MNKWCGYMALAILFGNGAYLLEITSILRESPLGFSYYSYSLISFGFLIIGFFHLKD